MVDSEIVPEEADLTPLCLLTEMLLVIEEFRNVDRLFVNSPGHHSMLAGDSQYECMGRLIYGLQINFNIRVSSRVLFWWQGLAGEHTLICVEYFVALLLGLQDLRSKLLLELIIFLCHVRLQSFLPTNDLFLDAVHPIDLRQEGLVHLPVGELPLE